MSENKQETRTVGGVYITNKEVWLEVMSLKQQVTKITTALMIVSFIVTPVLSVAVSTLVGGMLE